MTSRRLVVQALLSLPLLSLARGAHAATPLDVALQKIGAAREGLVSLSGPFTQERTIGLLAAKVKSTGTMILLRPDRLRWELKPPDAVVYWIGPEGLAFQSGRGEKGRLPPTQARVAAALEDLRAVLGGDLSTLKARYELTLARETEDTYAFEAKPRDVTSKIRRIDFELDVKAAVPKKVVLVDGPKDKTEIVFGNLLRNAAVDPAAVKPSF